MNWRRLSWGRLGCLATIGLLAGLGGLFALGLAARNLDSFYVDEETRRTPSPDGELVAYQRVTRGGFGTVWTTRIFVTDSRGSNERMIYSNRDSDFQPPFRWTGDDELRLTLPCGRIDHVGNPSDYAGGDAPIERFRVRFDYERADCLAAAAGGKAAQ